MGLGGHGGGQVEDGRGGDVAAPGVLDGHGQAQGDAEVHGLKINREKRN